MSRIVGPTGRRRFVRWAAIASGIVVVAIVVVSFGPSRTRHGGPEVVRPAFAPTLTAVTLDSVAAIVGRARSNEPVAAQASPDLRGGPGLVYVALRAGGRRIGSAWAGATSWQAAIESAVFAATGASGGELTADSVEVVLAFSFSEVRDRGAITNVHRGVRGLEVEIDGAVERYGPTEMLASNRSFTRQLERVAEQHGTSIEALLDRGRVRVFEARQLLVRFEPNASVIEMFRGNRLVRPGEITRSGVETMVRSMEDWMIRGVRADGRMTYKYWPSRGEESRNNNMIRQWMASICLGRIARRRGDVELAELAHRNIAYNFERFYREERELGLIEHDGKVKLGAIALAALAIAEHAHCDAFVHEQAALGRTVEAMWNDDGSFVTFWTPRDRTDGQNFYPGEALLLWATLLDRGEQPSLQEKFRKSFDYYRNWHQAQRNPAFVPWHSQAYYKRWAKTGDPGLRDWVFEMNDWLRGMQERSRVVHDDTAGRFYDPTRPFGPPHASSTGAYMEGLIDAYRLALEVGDETRAEGYRLALLGGIRSCLQLEFADEIDMFYVSRKGQVLGGLRTTVYDNEVRVDNVQHALMALHRILEAFSEPDYTR